MTGSRIILHLDMDAFYASVEQRDRPELRGIPLVVGGDPAGGRGVVMTASYEARKFGIRSAMPVTQAFRLCPHATFVPPRMDRYVEVSERVFGALRPLADVFEAASVDEAYLDVSRRSSGFDAAGALAREIQQRVREGEGLSCSLGVASNKLVAKIATDFHKPGGVTVVPAGTEEAFLAPLPARRIPGVGPKTEEALAAMGIRTCRDLAAAAPARLAQAFGVWGPRLVELARGADSSPVLSSWERKSLGSESTFLQDLSDPGAIRDALAEVARECGASLEAEGIFARTVTLKVRLEGFETFTRARTLPRAFGDAETVERTALSLLDENFPERPVRLLGVRLSHLSARGTRQATLAEWPTDILGEADDAWRPPAETRRWRF